MQARYRYYTNVGLDSRNTDLSEENYSMQDVCRLNLVSRQRKMVDTNIQSGRIVKGAVISHSVQHRAAIADFLTIIGNTIKINNMHQYADLISMTDQLTVNFAF
jgi:hypothetical protein